MLESINTPSDIRSLSLSQLKDLCSEIRAYMVEVCSENPGHLASSLGAVEIIVACHYVFDTPDDKLIFDVGHQAYAHKILTGRREAFRTMRTRDGISGFPKMSESEFDAFGVGHSSTSISAALGYAEAFRLQGRKNSCIAVIGDGSLTGGLAFDGLNNLGTSKSDMLVILNDNDHSIDDNVGAMHRNLLQITSSKHYNRLKDKVWNTLGDKPVRNFLQRMARSFKSWIVKRSGGDLFEALGMRYFGPIDGNDIEQMVKILRKMKALNQPRILHCITRKGKGYAAAEADPTVWHAPGKFNPETGERIKSARTADKFQDVFGEVLCELAGKDERVLGVTPAMASGCGMNRLAEKMPERFFDVGIEEEHAVTFSAGLAAAGMKPFCNIYSSFSQRAYDQIIHDVALQNLPVTICLDRAGLVGEDGATHHGMFDMSAYRAVPNCTVCAPADEIELKRLMYTAAESKGGPFIIRYPRGYGEGRDWKNAAPSPFEVGKAEELVAGSEIAVVAAGPCVYSALKAAEQFDGKVGVYNFRFLKPLDNEMLARIAAGYRFILTAEDGTLKGGLFGAVSEAFQELGLCRKGLKAVYGVGAPDRFIEQGAQAGQRADIGIDAEGIVSKIKEILKNN